MSQYTYISIPQPINEYKTENVNDFANLCFINKYFIEFDYENLDGFCSYEDYYAHINFYSNVNNIIKNQNYPKPFLFSYEKSKGNWTTMRYVDRQMLKRFIEKYTVKGEFIEIYSEVETSTNSHRLYLNRLGPPMIELKISNKELDDQNSIFNLTQHMMKVTIYNN